MHPILLLQICVQPMKQAFLFDAQARFRPLRILLKTMTDLEAVASQTLEGRLFLIPMLTESVGR